MIRPATGLAAVSLLMIATAVQVAAQPGPRPAVLPVDSLAWLAGHWLAIDGAGRHEGVWMEPSGGSMAGFFKSTDSGRVVRYEIFLIEQSAAGPVLTRRTYGPSLAAADSGEQWTRLRLREFSGMRARFSPSTMTAPSAITVERIPGDRLRFSVEHTSGGTHSIDSIEYTRQWP